MGSAMPFYRFYLLTMNDHIALRREAACDDDAHAIAQAAEVIANYPAVEVWEGERRVIRMAAEDIP
jgi:hypothetical protein